MASSIFLIFWMNYNRYSDNDRTHDSWVWIYHYRTLINFLLTKNQIIIFLWGCNTQMRKSLFNNLCFSFILFYHIDYSPYEFARRIWFHLSLVCYRNILHLVWNIPLLVQCVYCLVVAAFGERNKYHKNNVCMYIPGFYIALQCVLTSHST